MSKVNPDGLPGGWGSAEEVEAYATELYRRIGLLSREAAARIGQEDAAYDQMARNFGSFAQNYASWFDDRWTWLSGPFGSDAEQLGRYVIQYNEYVERFKRYNVDTGLPTYDDPNADNPEDDINWKLWGGVGLGIVALFAVGYVITSGTGLARAVRAGEPEIQGFAPIRQKRQRLRNKGRRRAKKHAQLRGLKAPRPISKSSRAPTRYALEVE